MTERFERDFEKLLDNCEKFGRPILTDYFVNQLRAMLRQFSRKEIEAALDIARAKGSCQNWAKYIWGILWRRSRHD